MCNLTKKLITSGQGCYFNMKEKKKIFHYKACIKNIVKKDIYLKHLHYMRIYE
jgi:hypothetical protein